MKGTPRLLSTPLSKPHFSAVALLIITLAAALWSCGGKGDGDGYGSPSPPPDEVLRRASEAMAHVSSFRFGLESQGGATPIPAGLEMTSAQGVMARPDRLDVTVKARFSGLVVEVRVISVGDVTFMTNPLTGAWQRFQSGLSPVAFFDPAKGVKLVLDSVAGASWKGEATISGQAAYRITGRIPASAVQFIAGSFAEGSVLEADLWITKEDLRLRQLRLDGRITSAEGGGLVRLLTFSDFDQSFSIRPPL